MLHPLPTCLGLYFVFCELHKLMAVLYSYGRVNGVHASEDPRLIGESGILRKEWGFDGLVMSDWYVRTL